MTRDVDIQPEIQEEEVTGLPGLLKIVFIPAGDAVPPSPTCPGGRRRPG